MLEVAVVSAFALSLLASLSLGLYLPLPLSFGFVLFFAYGLFKKRGFGHMLRLALAGLKIVRGLLLIFALIGIMTALWRSGGTIAFIVHYLSPLCDAHSMLLLSFLFCGLVSFLTGTAFGTAATMGVVCVTMANSLGLPIVYSGGAVLAGSYFGDRCSPMSSSALLVCALTRTDIFRNMANMFKSSLGPLLLSCAVYLYWGLGLEGEGSEAARAAVNIFAEFFKLHPAALLPAALIVLLSLFRVRVQITMLLSIVSAALLSLWLQDLSAEQLWRTAVWGYRADNAALDALLSGGGLVSMADAFLIVALSSSYMGLLGGTGLLDAARGALARAARQLSPFGGILLASILTGLICCSQSLTIMLTHQLCGELEKNPERLALHLENTAVVVAALVPWSIASAVVLASLSAPKICIITACYLYILPVWNYLAAISERSGGSGKRV